MSDTENELLEIILQKAKQAATETHFSQGAAVVQGWLDCYRNLITTAVLSDDLDVAKTGGNGVEGSEDNSTEQVKQPELTVSTPSPETDKSTKRGRGRRAAEAIIAPVEAAPVEAAPVEAAPVEAAPVEAAPVEVPTDTEKEVTLDDVSAVFLRLKSKFKNSPETWTSVNEKLVAVRNNFGASALSLLKKEDLPAVLAEFSKIEAESPEA